jgi:hypothetical protein
MGKALFKGKTWKGKIIEIRRSVLLNRVRIKVDV